MKIKKFLFMFLISAVLVAAAMGVTNRVIHAQSSGSSDPAVIAKLNEVLSSQKAIMEELSDIKEELRIIQIRVTQSQ